MKIRLSIVLFAVLSAAFYTVSAQQSSTPFIVAVTNINAANVMAIQQPGGVATLEFDLLLSVNVNWGELTNSANPKHLVRVMNGEQAIVEAPLFDFGWYPNNFIVYLDPAQTNRFILVLDSVKTARDVATEISGRGTIVRPTFGLHDFPAFEPRPSLTR
jgi:hypothetical protein